MPAKTLQAQLWASQNFERLQETATPYSVNDITNALFNLVASYKGGDSRLFLYSHENNIFFFNVNTSRNDVRTLVGKVSEGGGLIFGSDFSKSTPQFVPLLQIKPARKQ